MPSDFVSLSSPPDAPFRFEVEVGGAAAGAAERRVRVSGPGVNGTEAVFEHALPTTDQNAWLDLFHACAADFGTRIPHGRTPFDPPPHDGRLWPVLTEAASDDILYGYGDPSVLRVEHGPDAGWWLTATSNDAPNAFPILHSSDCRTWSPRGFVFRQRDCHRSLPVRGQAVAFVGRRVLGRPEQRVRWQFGLQRLHYLRLPLRIR